MHLNKAKYIQVFYCTGFYIINFLIFVITVGVFILKTKYKNYFNIKK